MAGYVDGDRQIVRHRVKQIYHKHEQSTTMLDQLDTDATSQASRIRYRTLLHNTTAESRESEREEKRCKWILSILGKHWLKDQHSSLRRIRKAVNVKLCLQFALRPDPSIISVYAHARHTSPSILSIPPFSRLLDISHLSMSSIAPCHCNFRP